MIFSHPIFLYCLPFVLIGISFVLWKTVLTFQFPSVSSMRNSKNNFGNYFVYFLPVLFLYISLILFFIALANPQKVLTSDKINVEGIGIMLVFDMSGSMQAEDFKPTNRFVASKRVITDFIIRRQHDLIGMVVFGTDAFLMSPLTIDYLLLQRQLASLEIGQIEGQTAIGSAIAKAVNHLRDAKIKEKIIILLTDGENNSGDTDPITGANLAAALGIKIYTIGVGSIGGAPIPYYHPGFGKRYLRNPDGSQVLTKLDEDTLVKIAELTEGRYFRATDSDSLDRIYKLIDKLEKTKIESKKYIRYQSKFYLFVVFGFVFLILYILLEFLILRIAR